MTGGTITASTPLQTWTTSTFNMIFRAHAVLNPDEYAVYIDVLHRRLTRELVEIHLDEWREAA